MPSRLPRSVPPSRRLPRRGLTLFELLIVLTIMGITAGLVVLRPGAGTVGTREADGALPITRARRLAVARAEVVQLVVRPDGAWTVLAPDGTPLDEGVAGGPALELQVDALGSCRPTSTAAVRAGGRPQHAFDPLTCRFARGRT